MLEHVFDQKSAFFHPNLRTLNMHALAVYFANMIKLSLRIFTRTSMQLFVLLFFFFFFFVHHIEFFFPSVQTVFSHARR